MERFDVEQSDRLAEIVEAVDRGEEVVLTRDGREVAKVVPPSSTPKGSLDLQTLVAARAAMASLRVADGAALIREMRDAAAH